MSPFIKYIYILFFCVLIGSISVSSIMGFGKMDLDNFRTSEKKQPTEKPVWNWEKASIQNYFGQLNSYINDFFPFRNELISFYSNQLYKMGISSNPDKIQIGKKGYLFLGNSYDRVIDQIKGKTLFDEKSLKSWGESFLLRKKYLENKGIPFYLVIVPKKHSIYSEYLPDYLTLSENDNFKQIQKNNLGLNIIFLKEALLSSKSNWGDLLYNKTDSHWSQIGSYIGYVEMIEQLKDKYPELEYIELDKNDFKEHYHVGGQNKQILNISIPVEDFIIQIEKSPKWDTNIIKTNYSGDTLPFNYWSEISYHEKAIVYNDKKPYTLLVLEDSFSIKLSKFLNQSFGKIIYCHYSDQEGIELTELVEKFHPDLVLYEFGEQSLFRHTSNSPQILSKIMNSLTPFLKIRGKELLNQIKPNNQIENIKTIDESLLFKSNGTDPSLLLPEIHFPKNKFSAVKIEFTVPEATQSQIFYISDENEHFNETNSFVLAAEKGINILTFYLPFNSSINKPLRFDPGSVNGEYEIQSVEFLESK